MVLAVAFGGSHGTADGVVEAAQLALGAGIHVAHAGYDGVRLIVEIEAVGDQFFELDLGGHFEGAAGGTAFAGAAVGAFAALAAALRTAALASAGAARALFAAAMFGTGWALLTRLALLFGGLGAALGAAFEQFGHIQFQRFDGRRGSGGFGGWGGLRCHGWGDWRGYVRLGRFRFWFICWFHFGLNVIHTVNPSSLVRLEKGGQTALSTPSAVD